jgi:hypothetical protein
LRQGRLVLTRGSVRRTRIRFVARWVSHYDAPIVERVWLAP